MVTAPVGPLLIVISARPHGLSNCVGGPLVKGLPQELRTSVAKMNPVALAASLPNRCDTGKAGHLLPARIALAIGSEEGYQTRRQSRSGSRQGPEPGFRPMRQLGLRVHCHACVRKRITASILSSNSLIH